jgi:hypothetical protein
MKIILAVVMLSGITYGQKWNVHDPNNWPDCSKAVNQKRCAELQREMLWSTPQCKCIKNEKGQCMGISTRPPRYTRGSGTQFQFLPTCVDDCLPGWADFETEEYHPRTDTMKEMDKCYIDWKRLRKLNPQWSDPNWTP